MISFRATACCFSRPKDVEGLTQGLTQAAPLIVTLAGDPSLRGLTRALSLGLVGVRDKLMTLDDADPAAVDGGDDPRAGARRATRQPSPGRRC